MQVLPGAVAVTTKPFEHGVVVLVARTKCVVAVTAGVPRVTDTPVLLVRVTLLTAPVVPTAVAGKVMEVGESETLLVPVPVSPMICGLVGSVSLMITAPFLAPVVVGVKVTLMVQLALAARVVGEMGQLLEVIA